VYSERVSPLITAGNNAAGFHSWAQTAERFQRVNYCSWWRHKTMARSFSKRVNWVV